MIVLLRIIVRLLADLTGLIALSVRPRRAIEAENLVLRRQLALFKEPGMKLRRIDAATRVGLTLLSQLCDWRSCLARPHMALGPGVPDPPSAVVRPATQLSRHQIGGRLVLRVKSILGGLHYEYSLAPALR